MKFGPYWTNHFARLTISAKHWESTSDISFQVLSTSIISQEYEVLQAEETIESLTNSIQNHTHSAASLKTFEKFDVSCFHVATPEEEIQTSIVE